VGYLIRVARTGRDQVIHRFSEKTIEEDDGTDAHPIDIRMGPRPCTAGRAAQRGHQLFTGQVQGHQAQPAAHERIISVQQGQEKRQCRVPVCRNRGCLLFLLGRVCHRQQACKFGFQRPALHQPGEHFRFRSHKPHYITQHAFVTPAATGVYCSCTHIADTSRGSP